QRAATEADLARIRAEALVHPDGLGVVLAPPGDRLRAFGIELRTVPGDVVLVMHADADGFIYPAADADIRVSAAQVAELLAALLPAPGGRRLNVCGCSVAADPEAGMRELALRLGMPVVAPRSPLQVHPPGRNGARVSTDGGWLRVDGDRPAEAVPGPLALLQPRSVPGAQRIGPPGVRIPIAPRAPPVTAGKLFRDSVAAIALVHRWTHRGPRGAPRWAQRIGTAVAAAALLGTLGLSLVGSASRPEAPARDQHAVVRLEVVRVSAGTVLELPARDASATQSGREVVTQPNDSVARLADGLGTTRGAVREAILRANPGMTLPKSDHTLLPAGTRFTAPAGTGDTWATQVDDNLTWIAHRFGLRAWIDIADANRDRLAGRDVDLIHPGENWDVPGAASPSPEPTVPTTPPTTGPTTPPTGPITPPATPATPPSPLSSEPTTAPTPTPSQTPTTGPETSTSTPGASPTPGGTGLPGPTGSPSELSDVRGSPSPVGRVVLLVVGGAAAVLAAGFGVWALLRRMRSWSAVDVVGSLTGARDGIRRGAAAFWGTPMGPGRA